MPQTIVALHMADTHLGYRQYSIFERELDIYKVFQKAVETAIEERVDLVIHAGDFFDTSKPPPQAIREALRALRRLAEHNIPVVAVLGDHDIPKRRGDHPLSIFEDLGLVKVLGVTKSSMSIRVRSRSGQEVLVAGLPHHKRSIREALLLRLRSLKPHDEIPSILVLHQGLEGYVLEPELSISELPKGFSYYALGHVHKPAVIKSEEVTAAYPGSIDALRMDEAQYEHGVLLVEIDGRNAFPTRIRLESRPQLVYTLDYERLESSLASIARSLVEYKDRPLLHLIIRGKNIDRKRVYKLIQNYIGERALYVNVRIEEYIEEAGVTIDVDKGLDLFEIMEKRLGDKMLARLAEEIIERVKLGAKEVEIEYLVEKYFRDRYGG